MKKKAYLFISILATLLGAAVFLTALMPAVTSTTTVLGNGGTSNSSFYDVLSTDASALNIAIIVVLSCGVALALLLTVALVLKKVTKKNKTYFAGLAILAALVLIAAGVMFFFVAQAYSYNINGGTIVSSSAGLGIGAIISGILAILAGVVEFADALKLSK